MVRIRTLVPLTHPTTEEAFPVDTVVDVADDVAAAWRAAGKVSLISDEERLAQQVGHYSDVVGREDVGQVQPSVAQPGPQAETEDEPKPRRRR